MLLNTFNHHVDDYMTYSIDYSNWLLTDEVLASVVVTVLENTDTTPLVATGSVSVEDNKVNVTISGGEADNQYSVTIKVTTDTPQIQTDCLVVNVTDYCS